MVPKYFDEILDFFRKKINVILHLYLDEWLIHIKWLKIGGIVFKKKRINRPKKISKYL